MKENRKSTTSVLMDLTYKFSSNHFEEIYGDHVDYSDIEQSSYIEFKQMVFEFICADVKFKKYHREKNILTLKAEMLDDELQTLINTKDEFEFIHDFHVTNIRVFTIEEDDRIKNKKDKKEEFRRDKNKPEDKDILSFINNYDEFEETLGEDPNFDCD